CVPLAGTLAQGSEGLVRSVLGRPVAAAVGDRFVLRDTSASHAIGGGRFIDLRGPARRRGTPERLAWLQAADEADPAIALTRLVALAPIELPSFLRDRALDPAIASALCEQAGAMMLGDHALAAIHAQVLRADLVEALSAFHAEHPDIAGLGREKLRLSLTPRLQKEAFLAFLHDEAAA